MIKSQSLRKSGRLFHGGQCLAEFRRGDGRNPFVNQVVCFLDKIIYNEAQFTGRNPFVNQVVCFL